MTLINPLLGSNFVTGPVFDPTLIGNSVWLDGSADFLSRTPSAGTTTRWIVSCWVQRNSVNTLVAQNIFSAGTALGDLTWIRFADSDQLDFAVYQSGVTARKTSSAKYRDIGWYHICVSFDSGSGVTASDRIKLFVNGIEVTDLSDNTDTPSGETTAFNGNVLHEIGRYTYLGSSYANVYLTQVTMLENKSFQNSDLAITDLLDSFTFGTNGSQFTPKSDADIAALATTAGGNSFCLDFADSADLGNDISSNANDFTPTSMAAANQSTNTPSLVYPSLTNIIPASESGQGMSTLTNGNLSVAAQTNRFARSVMIVNSTFSKLYYEVTFDTVDATYDYPRVGIALTSYTGNDLWSPGAFAGSGYGLQANTSTVMLNGSNLGTNAGFSSGDVYMCAFDPATGKIWAGKDGTYFNSGDPAAGSGEVATITGDEWKIFVGGVALSGSAYSVNFGQSAFAHTVPTDFVSLASSNLTAPDYQGIDYFKPVLYTGNGTAIGSGGKAVTGVGWQPDEVWIKNRDATDDHALYDIVRGVTKQLESNTLTAESTEAEGLTAFGSDGFTVGNLAQVNTNTEDYVSWNWLGTNSATTTSPAGTIASTSSAADAGHFSVGTYTGQTAAGTVGHGLGGVAEMVIVWDKGFDNSIVVYHYGVASDAATDYLVLNDVGAAYDSVLMWNDTAPTSSVFSVGTGNNTNGNTRPKSFLAFRSVPGVCKVGSFVGNANANGPYIDLDFKPAFFMAKSTGVENWIMLDDKRPDYNPTGGYLFANLTNAEGGLGSEYVDFLSSGVKIRTTGASINGSATFIYLAMADIGGNGTLPPVYGR